MGFFDSVSGFVFALTGSLSFRGRRGTPPHPRPRPLAAITRSPFREGRKTKPSDRKSQKITMKTSKNSRTTSPSGTQPKPELTVPDSNPTVPNPPPPIAEDFFGPAIFTYTRKQALADGLQVDVSKTAEEAGFRIPVFITDAVFRNYVKVPEGVECQDEDGRLWDVIWMLRWAITKGGSQGDRQSFQLYVRNDNKAARRVTLHSVYGALDVDDPSPSITVMMPNED